MDFIINYVKKNLALCLAFAIWGVGLIASLLLAWVPDTASSQLLLIVSGPAATGSSLMDLTYKFAFNVFFGYVLLFAALGAVAYIGHIIITKQQKIFELAGGTEDEAPAAAPAATDADDDIE